MTLPLPIKRLHLFEINDEPWFPAFLRSIVQDLLTEMWTDEIWPIQSASPASRLIRILRETLDSSMDSYTFVDCCAGAGGPTPTLEAEVNAAVNRQMPKLADPSSLGHNEGAADDHTRRGESVQYVDFTLTDLHPHVLAWRNACEASKYGRLRSVPEPVDATTVLAKEVLERALPPKNTGTANEKGVFRLFNLAFHHFDDEVALKLLENTLQTSDGFAIFELQGRDVGSMLTILFSLPLLIFGSWWWYWGQWRVLFWSGVVPVVPFVFVFDGLVSCLRTRRKSEMDALLKRAAMSSADGLTSWTVKAGEEMHTWPFGMMNYYLGVKN